MLTERDRNTSTLYDFLRILSKCMNTTNSISNLGVVDVPIIMQI